MTIETLLAMHANRYGRAFPTARFRHVHISHRPFVVAGYHLPGDPSAPIGLLFGDRAERPALAYTVEPTRWTNKIASMETFAMSLNRYIAGAGHGTRDAPQLLLANQAAVDWLCGDIGRHWRNLDEDGPWQASQSIRLAGANLSYFGGLSKVPGSSAVLPLADVLAAHYATGRLATLDRRLGVELAWIQSPDTIAGAEAELSDGPIPDASWEQNEYLVALSAYKRHQGSDPKPAMKIVEETVRGALDPTWRYAWQAHTLLREMAEAESVADRRERDRTRFRMHAERIRTGGARFRAVLPLLDAFAHIDRVERMTADVSNAMAFDDPIIMAAHVARGSALSGVVRAITARSITIRPDLPFERGSGTRLWWRTQAVINQRRRHVYIGLRVTGTTSDGMTELAIVSGALTAAVRDRLPAIGTRIVCAPFAGPDFQMNMLPAELPWTHRTAGVPA